MSAPLAIIGETPAGDWLTVPQILRHLQADLTDWLEWRELKDTPRAIIQHDGVPIVRRADYVAWLDAHTTGGPE